MVATCTLCGEIIKVTPDARGVDHTIGLLGNAFRKHMTAKQHEQQKQEALPPEVLAGTIGHLMAAMAVTTQTVILLSYLDTEDADFIRQREVMRGLVVKSIEDKPRQAAALAVPKTSPAGLILP